MFNMKLVTSYKEKNIRDAIFYLLQDDAMKEYVKTVNELHQEQGTAEAKAPPANAIDSGCEFIETTKSGRVFTIKLNRPAKKNALTIEVFSRICAKAIIAFWP